MSLKTFGCRTLTALAFGALTLHGVATQPVPPTPAPVIYQQGGGPGGGKWWLKGDSGVIAQIANEEAADEEAIMLVIINDAVTRFYT